MNEMRVADRRGTERVVIVSDRSDSNGPSAGSIVIIATGVHLSCSSCHPRSTDLLLRLAHGCDCQCAGRWERRAERKADGKRIGVWTLRSPLWPKRSPEIAWHASKLRIHYRTVAPNTFNCTNIEYFRINAVSVFVEISNRRDAAATSIAVGCAGHRCREERRVCASGLCGRSIRCAAAALRCACAALPPPL